MRAREDIKINNYGLRLTTNHPASSYGIPILVDESGAAYGPADNILGDEVTEIFGPTTGGDIVRGAMPASKTEDNRHIWRKMEQYLGSSRAQLLREAENGKKCE